MNKKRGIRAQNKTGETIRRHILAGVETRSQLQKAPRETKSDEMGMLTTSKMKLTQKKTQEYPKIESTCELSEREKRD